MNYGHHSALDRVKAAPRMTNAFKIDKPKTWKGYLATFVLMTGLGIANVYGTHQAIKHETEIKQYMNTKIELLSKQASLMKKCIEDYL